VAMKSKTAKSNVLSQADGFTDSNSKIRFHYDEMKIINQSETRIACGGHVC
jgi:hypothetical protein